MTMTEYELMVSKTKTFEQLGKELKTIEDMLSMPEKVSDRYNKKEKTRLVVSMTYGNGSDESKVSFVEDEGFYNRLEQLLQQRKAEIELAIKGL